MRPHILLALAAVGVAGAGTAAAATPERAAGYTAYVACSNSKEAAPSHSCGRSAKKAAFFVSKNADVLYDVCLEGPGLGPEALCPGPAGRAGQEVPEHDHVPQARQAHGHLVRGRPEGRLVQLPRPRQLTRR